MFSLASDASKQSRTLIGRLFGRRAKLESQLLHAEDAVAQWKGKVAVKKAVIQKLENNAKKAPTVKVKKKVEAKVEGAQFSLIELEIELSVKQEKVVNLTAHIKDKKEEQLDERSALHSLVRSVGGDECATTNPEFSNMNDFVGIL